MRNKKIVQNLLIISTVFWIADAQTHEKKFKTTSGNCCFNHQIGLPRIKIEPFCEMGLADYEIDIINLVEKFKLYALNKARGIGATELFLRWILFKAIHNTIEGRKFLIITGISGELAKNYIQRMTELCRNIPYVISKTQDRIVVGKSQIIAMAANPDAIRGYENVGVIFADEAAHWDLLDDDAVLQAIEPHRTKSDAHIIIVSTPNGRRGFFAKIFHNPETQYYTDYRPWYVTEGLLIDRAEVEKIVKEDYYRFEQEYNCKFLTTKYSAFPEEVLVIAEQNSEAYQLYD
jgi:hypothetical protein